MGELLQFPGNRTGSDAQEEGAERRSAPSRHPSRGRQGLEPDPSREEHAPSEREPDSEADEGVAPRWAVPGVDGGESRPVEPTRSSKRAENVALAALTRHDASTGEVRAKLVAKGLDDDDVEAELGRLRRVGLLDDEAFATRVLDRLRERKGLGDQAIRSALRGRLVPQEVIDVVLAQHAEDQDRAAERLQDIADDRARKLGPLAYPVAERRLTAYLMRKGYSGSSVRTAVRAALDGVGIS